MRKILYLLVVFFVISLVGCESVSSGGGDNNGLARYDDALTSAVDKTQKAVFSTCKIIPTVNAISAFIAIFYPAAGAVIPVTTAAQQICDNYRKAVVTESGGGLVVFDIVEKVNGVDVTQQMEAFKPI